MGCPAQRGVLFFARQPFKRTRSSPGEKPSAEPDTPPDVALALNHELAVDLEVLTVWFFLLAGSPIPNQ